MKNVIAWSLVAFLFVLHGSVLAQGEEPQAPQVGRRTGTVISIGKDSTTIDVRDDKTAEICQLAIAPGDTSMKAAIAALSTGDKVDFAVKKAPDGAMILAGIQPVVATSVDEWIRALVMLTSLVGLILVSTYLMSGHPMAILVGQDNRYSNSYFQLGAWFATLVVCYVATILLRLWYLGGAFMGSIGIPRISCYSPG